MKLSDFILLNEDEKKMAVLHQGILIAKRKNTDHMVFLFQLDSYYVETYCNKLSKSVEEFVVFGNPKSLTPWLDAIKLDDLLS